MVTMSGRSGDKQLFITPASSPKAQDHLDRTIRYPVTFDSINRYLHSDSTRTILKERGKFGAWGVTSGGGSDERFFNMLSVGDIVLFYSNKQSEQFEFLGEVIAKEDKSNPGLAKVLWNLTDFADLVYFLNVRKVRVSLAKFRSVVSYDDKYGEGFHIQRFAPVKLQNKTVEDALTEMGVESGRASEQGSGDGTADLVESRSNPLIFVAPVSHEQISGKLKTVLAALPVGDTSLPVSVRGVIPLDFVRDKLPLNELEKIYRDGKIRLWGTHVGNRGQWEKVEQGSIIITYSEGIFTSYSEVVHKTENRHIANAIWGIDQRSKNGRTWDFLIFVDHVQKINLPREEFNRLTGYKQNYVPQGFSIVSDKSGKLLEAMKLLSGQPSTATASTPSNLQMPTSISDEKQLLGHVKDYIQSSGYTFPDELIKNYWVCIKTKPFVLLTGIAGIGKTAFTRLFAEAIGAGENYRRIPVKADWRDDSDLLGYENPLLKPPHYSRTEFLDLMLRAGRQPEELFFVCLDEMNLARVEYYFAKFLSGLESEDRIIILHSSNEITDVPESLAIPHNLIFVGTVNMDETAFAFSPKVLDRANTLEISDPKLDEVHGKTTKVEPVHISFSQFSSYCKRIEFENLSTTESSTLAELAKINDIIRVRSQRFGFRVRNETLAYSRNSENIFSENPEENTRIAFDIQIKQKILPKLSGSSKDLRDSLSGLQQYFEQKGYERSLTKVNDMISRFDRDGFTSFYD